VITRVVAGLIYQGSCLLVCQRGEDRAFPLKWEFPGGKVERGEGDRTALDRELREELGIEVRSAREIFRHRHIYPNQTEVELIFFHIDDYQGFVSNRAFREIRWVEVEGLKKLDFLDGDRPLIERLASQEPSR